MLYRCPECGREISDKAPACPGCGAPTNAAGINAPPTETRTQKRPLARIIGLTLVLLVLGLIIWTLALPTKSGPPNNEQAESSAVAQLRVINTAEVTYASVGGRYGTIQDMIAAGLLDRRFAGEIDGYSFEVRLLGATNYLAIATPVGNVGRYTYSSGPDAVIRYAAGPPGTPIGQPVR